MTDTTATNLPANFTFSQSSLQAYVDCARRFWLAYVEQLPWPAAMAACSTCAAWATPKSAVGGAGV